MINCIIAICRLYIVIGINSLVYYFIYYFIGSEAAAVTGVTFMAVSFIEEFRASHPFIFLITERSTGAVLFMGRVCSPYGSQCGGPSCDNSFSGSGRSY